MWVFRGYALANLPNLTPTQYWQSTPTELADMLSGVGQREMRAWERTAWLATHIINVSGKSVRRPVKVDQLLGRGPRPSNDPVADIQELLRRQRERQAKENRED